MAADINVLLLGFHHAFVITDMNAQILDPDIPVEAFVNLKTVFDVLAKQGQTFENPVQVEIYMPFARAMTEGSSPNYGGSPAKRTQSLRTRSNRQERTEHRYATI